MSRQYLDTRSREEGSVLLFAVVVILFLATLSLFFKSATSPVFTHHQDARRTLQAEYLMASAENVLTAELLAMRQWKPKQVKAFLNDYKRIEIFEKREGLGAVRWVQEFNFKPGNNQGFEVVQSKDQLGRKIETIRFTKPVSYQIILDDNTHAVRKMKLQVSREQ